MANKQNERKTGQSGAILHHIFGNNLEYRLNFLHLPATFNNTIFR